MKKYFTVFILIVSFVITPLYGGMFNIKSVKMRYNYKDEDKNGVNDELQKGRKYYKKRLRRRTQREDKRGYKKKKDENSGREEDNKHPDTKR